MKFVFNGPINYVSQLFGGLDNLNKKISSDDLELFDTSNDVTVNFDLNIEDFPCGDIIIDIMVLVDNIQILLKGKTAYGIEKTVLNTFLQGASINVVSGDLDEKMYSVDLNTIFETLNFDSISQVGVK